MANNDLVQSLQRGMTILDLVARSGRGLTLMEIADALSVKRPTAFNLTRTLVAHRYLVKTTKPVRFLLGAALLENAEAWRHREIARKFEDLVRRLAAGIPNATVVLAEAMGEEVVAVHLIEKNRPGLVQHSSTRRLAPYVHASTLCFLAFWPPDEERAYETRYPFGEYGSGVWGEEQRLRDFLKEARNQGYVAFEAPTGRFLVGFPVCSPEGNLLATVGVSVATESPLALHEKDAIIAKVREGVEGLCRQG
jgi:DNA-binding IclR family transcriptional regulator